MLQNPGAMRPTSSRAGNFQEDGTVVAHTRNIGNEFSINVYKVPYHLPKNHHPSDASVADPQNLREQLVKINTNKQYNDYIANQNSRAPLSHRSNNQRGADNDELLPLMMLNPPIALFDEEDRKRWKPSAAANLQGNQQQQ